MNETSFFPSHRVVSGYVFRSGLSWKLRNFKNGCHFGVSANFLPGSSTGIWRYYQDSHGKALCSALMIGFLTQILTKLRRLKILIHFLKMVPSSVKQLTIFSADMVIQQWHIYTYSLMIIPWIVLELLRKMCLFHLNMNIEGRVCRHSVTSSETSSAWEICFMHTLHMVFPFMISNWSYTEQVKKIEKWRNF